MSAMEMSQESVMSDGEADRLISGEPEPVLSPLIAPTAGDTKNAAALSRARDAKGKHGSGSKFEPNLRGLMPIQPTTQISAAMAAMGGKKTAAPPTKTAAAGHNFSTPQKKGSGLAEATTDIIASAMASPFALITGEALISGSLESWRCENMPHTQERWADGGDASAWSPECQPTGNGLDLDSLLCDETPSTVSVMQKGFFGPDEGAPTPTRTSLRTLDLKNVHFDLDGVEEVRPSPEAILEAKLDRLAFLARADVKCAAHAAGRPRPLQGPLRLAHFA